MINEEMTLGEYCEIADRLLVKDYGISLEDAGLDHSDLENHYLSNQTPTEWLEWYAEKYDLFKINDPANWLGF